MPWPTMTDYQEAIQNPRTCFSDPELQQGRASLDHLGLPRPITGGFASVYKLNCSGRNWAIRCFLRDFPDHQNRYEAISRHLQNCHFQYRVGFTFQPQGIRIQGQGYPILKMEWIEGKPLNDFIESILGNQQALQKLASDWLALIMDLKHAGIAHGDLQHGNVLISNGGFKLIDYDGMFVPSLNGLRSHETGHPSYQHPKRSSFDFGIYIDNFAALAIYISIQALSKQPDLWNQFNNGDNILFRQDDFLHPSHSRVFAAIRRVQDKEVVQRVMALQAACEGPVNRVPEMDQAIVVTTLPSWVIDWKYGSPEVSQPGLAGVTTFSFSFSLAWIRPGPKKEKRIRHEPVYQERTRQVKQEKIVERPWIGWLLYIAIQAITLFTIPQLLIVTLFLGAFVFALGKGKITVEVTETYKEQIGTRDVEEWVTKHIAGHSRAVLSVSFSHDGSLIYSVGEDKYIFFWDYTNGDKQRGILAHDQKVTSVASANAGRVVTSSWDRMVKIWGENGSLGGTLKIPIESRIYSVATSKDGRLVACGIGQKQIYVWDIERGRQIAVMRGHTRKVLAVIFDPDGKRVISTSSDMTVRIWDIIRQDCKKIFYGHSDEVNCVAVSHSGEIIASGGNDGAIFLWDVKAGRQIERINAKSSQVLCLVFAPDGRSLISGGSDGIVRCWSIESGQEVGRLDGHSGPVRGLSLSPDAKYLASCGDDGTVRLWKSR